MQTLNIQAIQENIQKTKGHATPENPNTKEASNNHIFQEVKKLVSELYAEHKNIARFVIEPNITTEDTYCLTITPHKLEYRKGQDEKKKTITCDLAQSTFLINNRPAPPNFENTFKTYLTQAFKSLGEGTATLYEEKHEE
jgi:hypothetical protein